MTDQDREAIAKLQEIVDLDSHGRYGRLAREAIAILAAKPGDEGVQDAIRYRRLQIIGCAPDGTKHLENRTVLRFSNLDAFLDADIKAYPSRGDISLSTTGEPKRDKSHLPFWGTSEP